jgi:UDP-N-acetylmuramoyl-tripeptide--D-alanyl-D-alanine ligase
MTDISDTSAKPRDRLKKVVSMMSALAEMLIFVGDHFDDALRRASAAGLSAGSVRGFYSLEQASAFLKQELREGDFVLLKGRATDHLTRVFFAQFANIACWKSTCAKTTLCDECWELGVSSAELQQISPVSPAFIGHSNASDSPA